MKKFRPSESKREKRSRHKRKLVALAFYLSAFITAAVLGLSTKNDDSLQITSANTHSDQVSPQLLFTRAHYSRLQLQASV